MRERSGVVRMPSTEPRVPLDANRMPMQRRGRGERYGVRRMRKKPQRQCYRRAAGDNGDHTAQAAYRHLRTQSCQCDVNSKPSIFYTKDLNSDGPSVRFRSQPVLNFFQTGALLLASPHFLIVPVSNGRTVCAWTEYKRLYSIEPWARNYYLSSFR